MCKSCIRVNDGWTCYRDAAGYGRHGATELRLLPSTRQLSSVSLRHHNPNSSLGRRTGLGDLCTHRIHWSLSSVSSSLPKSFDAHYCHGYSYKHPMPHRHRMLKVERQSVWMSKITKRHRMLYICTRMATVGVKGLK